MYRIPDEFIPSWATSGNERFPASVDIICPFCGRKVNFALPGGEQSATLNGRLARARCPACANSALFLSLSYPPDSAVAVYMCPAPRLIRSPVEGIETTDKFPESLRRAYASAINAFNVREWTCAAVLCGRVLEGLAKSLLPEDKQNLSLSQQLRELPNHVDFQAPILMLADGIRKGRNIGAHFDAEKEPDQETTEMMMDLLDYIIEYLFVLPEKIATLHSKLAESGASASSDS
jgi:hypothetical protein